MPQDVKVKKVELIGAYGRQYSSFGSAVAMSLLQIRSKLEISEDHMSASVLKMKVSLQSIQHQKSNVEYRLESISRQQTPNTAEMMQLQMKLMKLKQVCKKAENMVSEGGEAFQ